MAQQQQQQQQQLQDEQLYPPQAADPAPNARNAAPVPPPQPAQQQYPQQPYPGHQAPQQQHPQQQYPGQMQQQPYPMQHQVIVQSSPHNGGSCSRKLENYKADQSFGLGLTQILIGVLCIIFNIVGIGLTVASSNYYYGDGDEFQFYTGYGMWPSILFIIAGGFGIGARSKNPCPIITFMIMSIFAAIFTIFVVIFSSSGIGTVSHEDNNSYNGYDNYYANAYWTNGRSDNHNQKHGKLAMHSLMLILAFVELVVAIWSSAICCHAACCCRDQRGAVHAAPTVTYGGQMVNGQQQVFIHTQGQYVHTQGIQQQPQYAGAYGMQYAGGSSYPAAGPGLAQPSASTPGMPPAYSAASAPPAYGGPPREEKSGMPPATN